MHSHETIKSYQKCSSKRWQWNEWLVFKVVASVLWIIQEMLSNFHASTLLFKRGNFSKETYGTKWNVGYCEIGILKFISYLYPTYLKNDLKHIEWIHAQKSSFINHFFLLFYFFSSFSGKSRYQNAQKMPGLCIHLL